MDTAVNVQARETLRPLGTLEKFSSARHNLGFFTDVGISVTYTLTTPSSPTDLPPIRPLILSALTHVLALHPILSTTVIDEETRNPYFARLPKISLPTAVTFLTRQQPFHAEESDEELRSILEEQHDTPFTTTDQPFWRLIVLQDNQSPNTFTASFIFHHSLSDGAGGVQFHKDFLSALNSRHEKEANRTFIPPSSPLPASLEETHRFLPITKPSPSQNTTSPTTWTGPPIALPSRSRLQTLTLSLRTTAALLHTARQHTQTLTTILLPLLARAISFLLPAPQPISISFPLNLRPLLPSLPPSTVGVYVTSLSLTFTPASSLWTEAARTKDTIARYLAAPTPPFSNPPEDFHAYLRRSVGKPRGVGVDVSNLGRLAAGEGAWRAGRASFTRSAFTSGAALNVSCLTGGDGCLSVGFVWAEGVLEEGFVKDVMMGLEIGIGETVGAEGR